MAELIPTYTLTELKRLNVKQLRRLKSAEITADGNYLFTFVNPQTDYIRLHTENLCCNGNQVSGESLEDITQKEEVAV